MQGKDWASQENICAGRKKQNLEMWKVCAAPQRCGLGEHVTVKHGISRMGIYSPPVIWRLGMAFGLSMGWYFVFSTMAPVLVSDGTKRGK